MKASTNKLGNKLTTYSKQKDKLIYCVNDWIYQRQKDQWEPKRIGVASGDHIEEFLEYNIKTGTVLIIENLKIKYNFNKTKIELQEFYLKHIVIIVSIYILMMK